LTRNFATCRKNFFANLDETKLLRGLEREDASGSLFSSFRKTAGGVEYCVKIPKPSFGISYQDQFSLEKYKDLLNQIGRDPYVFLPPMWSRIDRVHGLVLIMPWGEPIATPLQVGPTLDYLEQTYRIRITDAIQCHVAFGQPFISDWSDLEFLPQESRFQKLI